MLRFSIGKSCLVMLKKENPMALYKHWKKIALVLTSAFWASCEDSTSASSEQTNEDPNIEKQNDVQDTTKPISKDTSIQQTVPLYGINPIYDQSSGSVSSSDPCENDECTVESSPSEKPESSSSEEPESSSSVEPTTSRIEPKSSSSEEVVTNVAKIACVEAAVELKFDESNFKTRGVKCDDGEEYALEAICPDYGIDLPCSEATYVNTKSKKRYSAEEFKQIYSMEKSLPSSSSSEKTPITRSSNSRDKGKSSSSNLGEVVALYGVQSPVIHDIDQPIAVYGPPCYFEGNCDEENVATDIDSDSEK